MLPQWSGRHSGVWDVFFFFVLKKMSNHKVSVVAVRYIRRIDGRRKTSTTFIIVHEREEAPSYVIDSGRVGLLGERTFLISSLSESVTQQNILLSVAKIELQTSC